MLLGQSFHWMLWTVKNVQLPPTDYSPSFLYILAESHSVPHEICQELHHKSQNNKYHSPFPSIFLSRPFLLLHFFQMFIEQRIITCQQLSCAKEVSIVNVTYIFWMLSFLLPIKVWHLIFILSRIALFFSTSSCICFCKLLSIPFASIKEYFRFFHLR